MTGGIMRTSYPGGVGEAAAARDLGPRQVRHGKLCLVYCGDDRCDCDIGPLGRDRDWELGSGLLLRARQRAEERERTIVENYNHAWRGPGSLQEYQDGAEVVLNVHESPLLGLRITTWNSPEYPTHRDFGPCRLRLRVRSRWHPMPTAPRDGTLIEVLVGDPRDRELWTDRGIAAAPRRMLRWIRETGGWSGEIPREEILLAAWRRAP